MPKGVRGCEHGPKQCRDCRKAVKLLWRANNPDKLQAAEKRRYEKYGDRRRLAAREYGKRNRAKIRAYHQEQSRRPGEQERKKAYDAERHRTRPKEYRRVLRGMVFAPNKTVESIYRDQNGLCAICLKSLGERYHVDHDHKVTDGRVNVRGLLCPGCNHVLGHAYDSTATLSRAIEYLQRAY